MRTVNCIRIKRKHKTVGTRKIKKFYPTKILKSGIPPKSNLIDKTTLDYRTKTIEITAPSRRFSLKSSCMKYAYSFIPIITRGSICKATNIPISLHNRNYVFTEC